MSKDVESFERLFLLYHDGLFRLMFRVTGSAQESEDLVQETFLRLYEHQSTIQEEKIKPWLFQVAMNLGLNSLRKHKTHARHHQELQNAKRNVERTRHDPAELAWIRQTLQELPERQARLLLLYTAGFRRVEMAEALGIRPASIGQLLLRAKKAFRRVYEAQISLEEAQRSPEERKSSG